MVNDTYNRVEELEFLISVLSELSTKYKKHNSNLLEEIISTLKYRKANEIITQKTKSVYHTHS